MGTASRMYSHDTYVRETKPTTNFSTSQKLGLRNYAGTDAQYAYVHFSRPFPLGAKILSATLTLDTYAIPETGSHSISVTRVLSKFSITSVTYSKQPTVETTLPVTVTKTGALPGGQDWVFDVTQQVQRTADGEPWYGWRVATTDPVQRWLYAEEKENTGGKGPRLTVVWADEPDAPQSLSPNEGTVGLSKPTLSFEHVDVGGDVTLTKVRVQTSTTTSFASPTWDSGELVAVNGTPSIDLATTSYPGAPSGQRVYYRIRAMDGAGLWSPWSPVAWFVYRGRPTAAFTSFDPVNPKFWDSTPNISWSMTGGTQSAYRVTIARTSNPKALLWDTGKITSSDNVIQVPPKVLQRDDTRYRVILRLWDTDDRISVPGANAHLYLQSDVLLDTDMAVAPADWVTAARVGSTPYFDISWSRSASADDYEIARQDDPSGTKIILDRVSYEDTIQPGGIHKLRVYSAPARTRTRFIVRPVANGKRGNGKPTSYFDFLLEGVWLCSEEQALCISGTDQGSWAMPEATTTHQVVGARAPTVIREIHRGYEGEISGVIIEEDKYQPELTAQEKRDIFLDFKAGRRSTNLRLIAADVNIPVQVSEMNIYPTPDANLRYACSFNFFQDGEVWWDRQ